MVLELRIYRVVAGRMDTVQDRFENVVLPLWQRHGIAQLGFWTPVIGGNSSELYYMLKWRDLAEREERWAAFTRDPEWTSAKLASEADGALVSGITNMILAPTGFSALR